MGPISGLFRILAIIVFIVLGVLILGMGILIIFPNFSIFGYHYIHLDDQQRTSLDVSSQDFLDADIVRFETGRFDIYLLETDENLLFTDNSDINVLANRELTGFVRGDVEEPVLQIPRFVVEDGKSVAIIQMSEPDGLIFNRGMTFSVYVNTNLLASKDVEVVSRGGSVFVGNKCTFSDDNQTNLTSPVTKFGSLSVTADAGAVYLRSCEVVRDITVTKKSGDFVSYINLPNNVTASISDGLGNITLRNVGTSGGIKELYLDDVENSHITFNNIYGNLTVSAGGGILQGKAVYGELDIASNSCNIELDTVSEGLTVKGKDGAINIKNVLGEVNINNGNGSIELGNAEDIIYIATHSGNVTLPNLRTNAKVITHNGKINIDCTSQCDLVVRSHSGITRVDNLFGAIDYAVLDKGTATLDVTFNTIAGISKIYTESGYVFVSIPITTDSYLSWSTAKSANVQVYSDQSTEREGTIFFGTSTNPLQYSNGINIISAVGTISVKRI